MFKLLKRKPSPPPAYRNPLSPIDRFLSLTLALAAQEQATAIIIGMPSELPPSIGGEHQAEFLHDLTQDPRHPAQPTVGALKSSRGWRTVPLWLRIRGALYQTHSLPIDAHITFLAIIQDRLVSLDDAEDNPNSERFIEYDSKDSGQRNFAQVALWLDEDNTTRLEIATYLSHPTTVQVSALSNLVRRM